MIGIFFVAFLCPYDSGKSPRLFEVQIPVLISRWILMFLRKIPWYGGFPKNGGDPCSSSICKSFFPYQHISTIQLLGYPDFGNPQMVFWDDFPNVKTITASKSWKIATSMGFFHQNGARRYGTILWCQSVLRVHWKMISCLKLDLKNHGSEKEKIGKKYHEERRFAGQKVGSWHIHEVFFPIDSKVGLELQ